ncbi:MAG: MFS transporter [Cyanobacteria bacterium P01_F01_bin.150]
MTQSSSVRQGWEWVPDLPKEVWILSVGQLLLFIGQGFTMVYASIYFVNELGFSATQVGLALGSSGLSGIVGRFWAGSAIDSPKVGRRNILFLSTIIAAIACCCLAFATTFPLLVAGNLLLGVGLSLFWPATMAVTTDLTTEKNCTEAFALARLSDNLGLGLGAFLAGQYMAISGSYQALFLGKSAAYLICGIVVYVSIAETLHAQISSTSFQSDSKGSLADGTTSINSFEGQAAETALKKWGQVIQDSPFLIYILANIFVTTYTAQLSSTLPLYLANFIPSGNANIGFSEQWISYFFVWHSLLKISLQLPITRWVKRFTDANVLMSALGCWMVSFGFIWLVGNDLPFNVLSVVALMLIAFTLVGMGEMLYGPTASGVVGQMAPAHLRGIYFSLDSQCWALGYMLGPAFGGWSLDHPDVIGSNVWLVFAGSVTVAIALINYLENLRSSLA